MCDKYIQKIIYKHITNLWLYSCGAQNRLSAWSAERFWPLRHPHLASSPAGSASVTMPAPSLLEFELSYLKQKNKGNLSITFTVAE